MKLVAIRGTYCPIFATDEASLHQFTVFAKMPELLAMRQRQGCSAWKLHCPGQEDGG